MGIFNFGKTLIKLKKCDKADLKSEQSLRYQKATCVSVQACEEGNPEKNLHFCQKVSKKHHIFRGRHKSRKYCVMLKYLSCGPVSHLQELEI